MERSDRADRLDGTEAAEAPARAGAGAPLDTSPAVTLFVCITCRAAASSTSDAGNASADTALADGAALAEAVRAAAGGGIAVKDVRCLANCKRALSAAMVRRDGWTYVFGDLLPAAAPDLAEGARLLAEAPDGLMPWRGRPESLKRGMVARIPPLRLAEES